MTEEQAEEARRSDRPLLVYIYPDARSGKDDPRIAVEEDPAFRDEGVVVGARFFDCVRIRKEDAQKDSALKGHAGSAPCLVLVRPDLTADRCLPGRFDADRIFAAMHDTLEEDYGNCLRQTLKEQGKVGEGLASIRRLQSELATLDRKIAGQKSATRRKQLEEKRKALADEIQAAEDALRAQEDAIYQLKPKTGE